MAIWRTRRVLKIFTMTMILVFAAGCFMGISSLMQVDSSADAEAARNAVKLSKQLSNSLKDLHEGASHNLEQVHDVGKNESKNDVFQVKIAKDDSDIKRNFEKTRQGIDRNVRNDSKQHEKYVHAGLDNTTEFPVPNYSLHAFYYPWYGNPEFDRTYIHWNHEILQHWNKKEAKKWPHGRWKPPGEIGANFYPQLGCYSSRDPSVIEDHMKQLRLAGIGVMVFSWYPASLADSAGNPIDNLVPRVLSVAEKYKIKVLFHVEPYKGRNEMTLLDDIKYIIDNYGSHPAFYRYNFKSRSLPVFYIYDSYLTNSSNWNKIFGIHQPLSVRNTEYDGLFLGLYVEASHKNDIIVGGFDGFYTYFASNGFTYASRWQNWKLLAEFARKRGLLFIPSVGPGYVDTRVRPWNTVNTKRRDNGAYYERSFQAAVNLKPQIISITSFNEWHEGTQIERAAPQIFKNFTYLDYGAGGPDMYLLQTQKWSKLFQSKP